MYLTMTTLALLAMAQAAPALPADPRLAPVRAEIEAIVSKATEAGLPSEVIVSKVREGLAKGIEPRRIGVAAERLAQGLAEAKSFVRTHRADGVSSPELVRAVAEAKLAGVDLKNAEPLLRKSRDAGAGARAIEVLTDLSRRGYPVERASEVVAELLAREPGAVTRLPGTLETVRTEQALTHAESMDQVGAGLRKGGSLQAAAARAAAPGQATKSGPGPKAGGQAAPPTGTSGFVPPGQLKKQTDAARVPPGSSRGKGKDK